MSRSPGPGLRYLGAPLFSVDDTTYHLLARLAYHSRTAVYSSRPVYREGGPDSFDIGASRSRHRCEVCADSFALQHKCLSCSSNRTRMRPSIMDRIRCNGSGTAGCSFDISPIFLFRQWGLGGHARGCYDPRCAPSNNVLFDCRQPEVIRSSIRGLNALQASAFNLLEFESLLYGLDLISGF